MSYAEVLSWVAYRDKHGSLNPMRRGELSAAIIALQVNRGAGGNAELTDFMPNAERPELSLAAAIESWT